MGIKKRSKINAEFNMSSMTDIIFLLLIFFMLTSSLVAPNALNLKLPGNSSAPSTSSSNPPDVVIRSNGSFYLNRKKVSERTLSSELARLKKANRGKLDILISPDKDAPVEHVVTVMDIAMRLQINGILATEKE